MSTNNADYHKMLGVLEFQIPNMKPLVSDAQTTAQCPVFYTPDVANFLTGVEIDYLTDTYLPIPVIPENARDLAIQVAVLVGPGGTIYHFLSPDFIRVEGDEPVSLANVDSFIITKRVLPYQDTVGEDQLSGISETPKPPPLLRSASCEFNLVADANIVFDQSVNEEWMNRVRGSEIGASFMSGVYSLYPEYGTYYFKYGFKNIHSAGWNGETPDVSIQSQFYKAESSLNTVPCELYRLDYYMGWRWRMHRKSMMDKYGFPTHYSVAYQYNQKGSYYRQGLDGNMYYPANMDPTEYGKYATALVDDGNGNLTPYSSAAEFVNHLSPENFYNVNMRRVMYFASGYTVASPIRGLGINLTGSVDSSFNFNFHKYDIFIQSLIHKEFTTGGRLGLYASFSDMFKTFKERQPLISPEDSHTIYTGTLEYVDNAGSNSQRDPNPIPKTMEKSLEWYERYRLGGGDAMTMALSGWHEWYFSRMINWPHEGYTPSLAFDIKYASNARSILTYPITEKDADADGKIDESTEDGEDISSVDTASLLTEQILQNTYVYDLVTDVGIASIDLENNRPIESELFRSINFYPVTKRQGILNLPVKDSSSSQDPDIRSSFGTETQLSIGELKFDSYVYWATVDGPILIPEDPAHPELSNSQDPIKTLICFGSDLKVALVDHAKICNRCYNMVRTVTCTASSMPPPLQSGAHSALGAGRDLTSTIFAASYSGHGFCHSGMSPPEPRDYYLDKHYPSGENDNIGGCLNRPVIARSPGGSAGWPDSRFWDGDFPFTDEDKRHVTTARKWRDKTALGRKSVWSDHGHIRSTIFDFAWNYSVSGITQNSDTRNMSIPQGSIQTDGFVDMIGNVPVQTMFKRVGETGALFGGVYTMARKSYTDTFDNSAGSQFSPMMGFTLGGLMATVSTLGGGSSMNQNHHTAMNKAEYVKSIVYPVLYNHNQAEVGVALGSGCSNISIYHAKAPIGDDFGDLPKKIYSYYGYAASPHYIGLHSKGFLWIPTDIGYYIHDDNIIPSELNTQERRYEWLHPLLRNGEVRWNFSPSYPTIDSRPAIAQIDIPSNWSNGTTNYIYTPDARLITFPGVYFLPSTANTWGCVPRVQQSEIYRDSVFTVIGSYGQVTNGDSSYWQYVESFVQRDLTSEQSLNDFNSQG